MLQCVAVCRSVLQCVALCCIVQIVTVCYSVLQWISNYLLTFLRFLVSHTTHISQIASSFLQETNKTKFVQNAEWHKTNDAGRGAESV